MKALISLVVLGLIALGFYKAWEAWELKQTSAEVEKNATINPARLQGMDFKIEPMYREAQSKGAYGLRDFIDRYKGTQFLEDPKLAWIELDYALLLSVSDPPEARKVFNRVRARINSGSPVYARMKSLEKSFQ